MEGGQKGRERGWEGGRGVNPFTEQQKKKNRNQNKTSFPKANFLNKIK